jgi:hypothetical protein
LIGQRFLSVDPVTAYSPGGAFNQYWYANANPYVLVDPNGLEASGTSQPCKSSSEGNCPDIEPSDDHRNDEAEEKRKKAEELIKKINGQINDHPNTDVVLSKDQFMLLVWLLRSELKSNQQDVGVYKNMSIVTFLKSMKGGLGDSQFILWSGEIFNVQSVQGLRNGRHLGNDINYLMQGMSWAAAGRPKWMLNAAVGAWNYGQAVWRMNPRDAFQVRQAQWWADYGYDMIGGQ